VHVLTIIALKERSTSPVQGYAQNENMEEHEHPHPITHKKRWSDYLSEFLMLFLAVFLGFVAENIREDFLDRHTEKEYMESMVNDLKTDTAKLGHNIRRFEQYLAGQDSLFRNFNSIGKYFSPLGQSAQYNLGGFPDFIYSDGTMQQLKNSGGLRLVRNKKVVDTILAYDTQVRKIFLNMADLGRVFDLTSDALYFFINFRAIDSIRYAGGTGDPDRQYVNKHADPENFYSLIRKYNLLLRVVRLNMIDLKEKATSTLQFVKKEYDLK
jgi:hypothetical protein